MKKNIFIIVIFYLISSFMLFSNMTLDNAIIQNDIPILNELGQILYLKNFPKKRVVYLNNKIYSIHEYKYYFKNNLLVQHTAILKTLYDQYNDKYNYLNSEILFNYYYNSDNNLIKIEMIYGDKTKENITLYYKNGLLYKKNDSMFTIKYFYNENNQIFKMSISTYGFLDFLRLFPQTHKREFYYDTNNRISKINDLDQYGLYGQGFIYFEYKNNELEIKLPNKCKIIRLFNNNLITYEKYFNETEVFSEYFLNYDNNRLKTYIHISKDYEEVDGKNKKRIEKYELFY